MPLIPASTVSILYTTNNRVKNYGSIYTPSLPGLGEPPLLPSLLLLLLENHAALLPPSRVARDVFVKKSLRARKELFLNALNATLGLLMSIRRLNSPYIVTRPQCFLAGKKGAKKLNSFRSQNRLEFNIRRKICNFGIYYKIVEGKKILESWPFLLFWAIF